MLSLLIDNHRVEVPEGSTILDAARKLGVDIPTLCFREGYKPLISCMICLVKVKDWNRIVPSCATPAEEGMRVESDTEEVRQIRKTGLELLLADHVGDCTAPCQNACPAHMDIPLMLRQVASGRLSDAIATVKKDIALPAVLGRVCPEVCEHGCRRGAVDSPAAICLVKRYVADVDLASETPYIPPRTGDSGKKVAIIGAGPTGLSAAFHLLQMGHACTVFDDNAEPGGMLRTVFDADQLPRAVLDGEIAVIARLGAVFRTSMRIGDDVSLTELRRSFDAILVAVGALAEGEATRLGLGVSENCITVDANTHETSLPGVFAAGDAVRPSKLVVRCVADGKAAAICIDQYLSRGAVIGLPRQFSARAGRLQSEELVTLSIGASTCGRSTPSQGAVAGLTREETYLEAARCLQCDCGKQANCRLRYYAQQYGAKASHYRGARRPFERHLQHAEVIYEPGKCILCGLCVRIATEAGEPLGLTFVGRGFDVRVGVPFDESIAEGLKKAARECAEACPTGALVLKESDCGCVSRNPSHPGD